jgi:outer membrane protein assembly factor BamB
MPSLLNWRAPLLAAALAAVVIAAGCGGSSSPDPKLGGTAYPGADTASSRYFQSPIEGANAAGLKLAWQLPETAQGNYGAVSATPAITGGVAYSQDLESNVEAISLDDGRVLWTAKLDDPDQGPNGVTVAGDRVFGATASRAFALDQETGEMLWSVPLAEGANQAIDMAPGYHDGLVYVSTVPTLPNSEYRGGSVGVLWALDAKTGRKRWHFDTAPPSLWGDKEDNAGGGLWYPPSFDSRGGMYFGTGNPVPFPGTASEPWGASRPGPNLYTDSMVKLDARTGKLDWYYQQTPHDVYDWDFQDPPILASAGGRELAIGAGKSGVVVALDAETGKPVWKRPVGRHNGHDEDDLLAMRGEAAKIKGGEVFPGTLGGVIAPMAANQTTVFVPVVDHALTVTGGSEVGESPGLTGELVALSLRSGAVRWKKSFPAAAFGAPAATNDMVFVATFDGVLRGFDAGGGGEVWQARLPAASNTGIAIGDETMVVPAGLPVAEGQQPAIVAYRVGG